MFSQKTATITEAETPDCLFGSSSMSCAGVMYQPYSSAPYLPSPAPSTSPTHPTHPNHPAYTTETARVPPAQQEHALPNKRELAEKQYKVERDPIGVAEPYSSPRAHNGSSAGSCGTPGPRTPVTPRPNSQQGRESDSETADHSTAQYLSRNVILYTHYNGDVSDIVDEHFSKALNQSNYDQQKGTPMDSRNLPPSFFNQNYRPSELGNYHSKMSSYHGAASTAPADLYSEAYTTGLQHLAAQASAAASPDPWQQYAAQASAGSSYHRSVHDLVSSGSGSPYQHASRLQSQYLFLNSPAATRLAPHCGVKTEAPWPGAGPDYHTPTPGDFSHPLDRNYSPHPYPSMSATGLEGQDASKDLAYWPTF